MTDEKSVRRGGGPSDEEMWANFRWPLTPVGGLLLPPLRATKATLVARLQKRTSAVRPDIGHSLVSCEPHIIDGAAAGHSSLNILSKSFQSPRRSLWSFVP